LESTLLQLSGDGHVASQFDIANFDEAHDAIIAHAANDDPFDGVFHSAGVVSLRLAKLYNIENIHSVFDPSVNGALAIAKACAKKKVFAEGGSIVFISSVAGSRGRAGMGVYAASRAALGGLTRALAAELAPRAIRVNEIVAGAIETPMHETIVKNLDQEGHDQYRDLHMLGFGKPEDIANAAAFLLSAGSAWITGSSFSVDGGYMAR
jgi:NAD(P)-dependent dehydrogenase (short-subunit alcohol dehydrogenase family)